jgi:quinol monooxygenase YgiN
MPLGINKMIFVIARIQLQSGTKSVFLEEFHKLVPLVHAEDGCIEYCPTIEISTEIPTQKSIGNDTVMVIEKWRDLKALEAHLAAPHMADYRARVKDYVLDVRLEVLKPA